MQATQDDLFVSVPIRARRRRNRGMRKAAEHAEDVHAGWNDAALEWLKQFVEQRQFAPFLAEEFKHWAQTRLPPAPDARAFGPVMQRAAALGVTAEKVRHPSMGGASAFRAGLHRIVEGSRARH